MKYFAAFLKMKDLEKNKTFHQQHVDFLTEKENEGKIFARGKFMDGEGGLVVYIAGSREEAVKLAESDPYVSFGARTLDIHEWDMKVRA